MTEQNYESLVQLIQALTLAVESIRAQLAASSRVLHPNTDFAEAKKRMLIIERVKRKGSTTPREVWMNGKAKWQSTENARAVLDDLVGKGILTKSKRNRYFLAKDNQAATTNVKASPEAFDHVDFIHAS